VPRIQPFEIVVFGGEGGFPGPGERKTNTAAGSYTAAGQTIKYTADYSKGSTIRYYFD